MEMRWSLDKIYTGFDSPEFKADFTALRDEIERLCKWADENLHSHENARQKTEHYISALQKIYGYSRISTYANLTLSVDTLNERAWKICDQFDELWTGLTNPSVLFEEFIGRTDDLDGLIKGSALLEEHSFLLNMLKEDYKYQLSDKEELILAKLRSTGSTAWNAMREQLTSTLLVDIVLDGEAKKLPLSVIRNMAYEGDQSLRKTAYEAELKAYEQLDKAIAFSLNAIKGEVITVSKLRGYESPLDMTLFKSRMERKTLDTMMEALKESLPMFRKYFRKKAEILGHSNGLPFYDLFAPVGGADMRFTYDEAADFVVKHFRRFSDELGDFAQNAFSDRWIDAEPREGKTGGAFCAGVHAIKESRIMANFNGSVSDALTLAHELGHGYHGHCLRDASVLNSDYPMPIAETASNFCEIILTQAALQAATDAEKLLLLEQSIGDAAQVVVDIYSRYLFETAVFESRPDGSLTVDELKTFMLNAQKEAYGDGLDPEYLHPFMWLCKSHYYSADYNFYNFPYAYGMLFAKGLYAQYLRNNAEFVSRYNDLLLATGRENLRNVGLIAGIDVNDIEFWRSSFKVIEADIEKFLVS